MAVKKRARSGDDEVRLVLPVLFLFLFRALMMLLGLLKDESYLRPT